MHEGVALTRDLYKARSCKSCWCSSCFQFRNRSKGQGLQLVSWFLVIDDDRGYSSYPLRCRHPWKSLVFGQFRHQPLHLYLINRYEDLKNSPSSFVILSIAANCKSQLNPFTLVSRCQYTILVIAGRNWRAVCQTCLPLDCRSAIHCSELFLCVIAGLLQLATRKPIRSRVPWFFSEESRCDNDN